MASALAERLDGITRDAHLTHEQVGEIVRSSPRSVSRWQRGEAQPQPMTRRRLIELAYVAEELARVIAPADANLWIFSPNRLLNHDTPAQRIADGDFRSVLAAIEALADGVVV